MQKSSRVLPTDATYVGHRDAERRRRETREWLREREEHTREAQSSTPSHEER
jgi:hypothetical protein